MNHFVRAYQVVEPPHLTPLCLCVQYIDESSLPKEYGGKDVVSIMQSEEEARLRAYAKAKVRRLPI